MVVAAVTAEDKSKETNRPTVDAQPSIHPSGLIYRLFSLTLQSASQAKA